MTTIYGLRELGAEEVRYVGRTEHPLGKRLRKHQLNARHGYPPRISAWINAADAVEIVAIAVCEPADATKVERAIVEEMHQAGARLTNSHLLPRARETGAAA